MHVKTAYSRAANLVLDNPSIYTATAFASNRLKVRVTRRRYRRGKPRGIDLIVTIGPLNYAERQYVRRQGLPKKAVTIK
jgi:hypothetical protein